MQSTDSDKLKAVCERWSANYSWDEMVDQIVDGLAKYAETCKKRLLSLAELKESAFVFLNGHMTILRELHDGDYYGYRAGHHACQKQMRRIESACGELEQAFAEREADQSLQAKGGEAQLSARYAWETDKSLNLGNFPRLHDVPDFDRFAKKDSGERLADYMTADLRLKHPGERNPDAEILLADPNAVDMRHGFLDVVEALASDGNNLFEHPNPPAHIRNGLNWKAKRRRTAHRKKWMPPTPEQELGFGVLKNPRNIETQLNARIDWQRGLAELGLSSDQIQALKAKHEGLGLQGSETAESLGLAPDQLERARRLLCPDQKPGKALRAHFAAYNPAPDAK
jgi:hypothetical protein